MIPSRRFFMLVLLMMGGSSAADAQDEPPPAGTRVRVHPRSHSIRPFAGDYVRSTSDTLYLVPDGAATPRAVALADIRRLQQSRGEHSNFRRGALIGAVAGAGAGLAVGLAEPRLEEGAEESALIPIATATVGALAGGIVGGLIGAMSRSERWEPMIWAGPAQRTPDARGGRTGTRIGIGVGISVAGSGNFSF
jgi:hypothetical protein